MMIQNAYAIPFNGSTPATAVVQVRASQTGAMLYSLENRPAGASSSTSVAPAGMSLSTNLNVSIPGPTLDGQIIATVKKSSQTVSCSASYKLVKNAPQPSGQLLFTSLGYNILGWDSASGYWFKRNTSTNVAEAFAKWPTGIVYDNVNVGDFNKDQWADVIGRNPTSGEFYVALANVVSESPIVAFTTDPTKPFTNFRIADITADGRSDVIFNDHTGGEVSYQPEQVANGVYFRGPIATPPTLTVSLLPFGIIPAGLKAKITWSSNVPTCTLYGPTGTPVITPQGPVTGKTGTYETPALTASIIYVMQCVAADGSNPIAKQIPIQVGPPLNVDLGLTVDKEFVAPGTNVLVSIQASNVNQCVLDKDGVHVPVPASLQVNVPVTPPAKFTVNCKKYTGEPVSATKTVYGVITLGHAPASLNFGDAYPKSTSAPQTFTVSNPNPTHHVQVSSITMPPNAFNLGQVKCGSAVIAAGQPMSIPPGGNCTVNVIFAPQSKGDYNAALKLNFGNGVGMAALDLPVRGRCVSQPSSSGK